jgi:hypothetical protein
MRPPTVPEQAVPVVPVADLRTLLNACQGRDFLQLRNTALIRLTLEPGGMRRAEAIGLIVASPGGQGQLQGFVEVLGQWLNQIGAVGADAVDPGGDWADRKGLQNDPVEVLVDLVWLGAGGVEPCVDAVGREDERGPVVDVATVRVEAGRFNPRIGRSRALSRP